MRPPNIQKDRPVRGKGKLLARQALRRYSENIPGPRQEGAPGAQGSCGGPVTLPQPEERAVVPLWFGVLRSELP